ncbi:MAG: hypothetical protein ACHQT5_00165 [Candidatus Saccharimonadales bacterium]|jgi:hypothetical protein
MNLSIEDLEAIKAIVREVVKEELTRRENRQHGTSTVERPAENAEQSRPEQPQEVVARIPRM